MAVISARVPEEFSNDVDMAAAFASKRRGDYIKEALQEKMERDKAAMLSPPTGEVLRDSGIQKVSESCAEWMDDALLNLHIFLTWRKTPFMAEEFRKHVQDSGLVDNPPHYRAWGALFQSAAKKNIIKRAGYDKSKSPKSRCSVSCLWVGV